MTTTSLYGGIEAGGTKFVCMIASGPNDIRNEIRFPTTTPDETIERAIDFFKPHIDQLKAIGVGSFGPIDLRHDSATYGFITSTPKPNWANTDLVGKLKSALNLPIAFDTDVNAAAFGEYKWGALQNCDSGIYITIGTGIGGGAIVQQKPLHGLIHPEMGHMLLPHNPQIDPFPGACPYHRDCFEGLASGPAMQERWGKPAEELPDDHQGWKLEAKYAAYALCNLIVAFSPQRIVLGGGVMQHREIFPMIRREVPTILNGYVQSAEIIDHSDRFIVPPGLGSRSGVLGSIALALEMNEN